MHLGPLHFVYLHQHLYSLVHVLDSSAPDLDEHRSTVLQVLQQIDVSEEKINNMIEVWNKVLIEISFSLALGNHLVVILDLYISWCFYVRKFQTYLVVEKAETDGIEDEIFLCEDEEEGEVPSEQSSFVTLDDGAESEYLSE
jgi:hypothetical protein